MLKKKYKEAKNYKDDLKKEAKRKKKEAERKK